MPTFGEWERIVLEHTWGEVDYISAHAYYQEKDGDLAAFLASPVDMDRFIESVADVIDEIAARRGVTRPVTISFDEWNVWDIDRYHAEDKHTAIDDWPIAPRILEDSYSVADAVVVGGLLMSLVRHADRVTAASLAQLVNVIAPIMTEPGGAVWRQTTFHPFAITSRLARGRAIPVEVDAPGYVAGDLGEVRLVDAVATTADSGSAVFVVNRSTTESVVVTIDVSALGVSELRSAVGIWDADPYARNSVDDPERVVPRRLEAAALEDGVVEITLPPVAWAALELG